MVDSQGRFDKIELSFSIPEPTGAGTRTTETGTKMRLWSTPLVCGMRISRCFSGPKRIDREPYGTQAD